MAKKVFIAPKNEYPNLKLQPAVSTPVHHHLLHHCPEQWVHHHEPHADHHGHGLHELLHLKPHDPADPHYSVSDVAMMALDFKHQSLHPDHVHHHAQPTMEPIAEIDEPVTKPSDPETGIITKIEPTTSTTTADHAKHENLNDSREVNLPASETHSKAGSDTAFEDDPLGSISHVVSQLAVKRSLVKMNDDNFDEVKALLGKGEMNLGITLLKRLRKYGLISSTVNHDGRIVVGISPRTEGRIKVVA